MGLRSYTDEQLADAVATSRSWRAVLRQLGLAATSSAAIRSVRRNVERLELDTTHFTGQRSWTEDELGLAVASSHSWSEVLALLGLSGGSSTSALKGHALRLGIDTQHFGRPKPTRPPGTAKLDLDLKNLPRAGSMLAATWFTLGGYDVSWPLEPCRYDLVARSTEAFLRVQVKTTRTKESGGWVVMLSTNRGRRVVYDPADIDYFFVVDGDLNGYLIPVATVGGMHTITLSGYEEFKLSRDFGRPS